MKLLTNSHMVRRLAFILGILSVTLTSTRCDDSDDNFRYSPANANNRFIEITFNLVNATADDSFMDRTNGFCEENRDSLKIAMKDAYSFIVKFPSPNTHSKADTKKTADATVTTTSYVSHMVIDGKRTDVKTFFTLTVPHRFKDYYMDFEYELTEVEVGGQKANVAQYSAASGFVDLVKASDGSWKAKN